jgi:hypothetical protein
MFKIQYYDSAQREKIVSDNSKLLLISEENISEGNFLTFEENKDLKILDLENQVLLLQNEITGGLL